jgi:hypothetical protein
LAAPTHPQRTEAKSASDEAVAKRAYEKYVGRGRADGFDREDWAAASRELMAEALGSTIGAGDGR